MKVTITFNVLESSTFGGDEERMKEFLEENVSKMSDFDMEENIDVCDVHVKEFH